jgi:hypothetical protein
MSVAVLALAFAATGTGYAAVRLPARSVGSRELKANAVTRHDLGAGAVTRRALAGNAVDGSKVARDTLTGDDIDEATLVLPAGAPRASASPAATTVGSSTTPAAAAVDVVYSSAPITIPPGDSATTAAAACPERYRVVGGGVRLSDPVASVVSDSYPDGLTRWEAHILNAELVPLKATAYAICVPVSGTG